MIRKTRTIIITKIKRKINNLICSSIMAVKEIMRIKW